MPDLRDPDVHELSVLERLLARPDPFTTADALAEGATFPMLRMWETAGLLRHPIRGVYHSPAIVDDLDLRLAVLRLVVPGSCVVTDRTAAWLWGAATALAPGDHLRTPRAHVFSPPGHRLRNGLVASGERRLPKEDVVDISGLRVTTPLRTACDLGRLLHRDQALAALDSMAALERFSSAELAAATLRFRRYRGVIQLRALVPLVDPAAQSPGESVLRLRWLDVGLPRPRCQVPVPSPWGGWFYLDLGLEERRFAAEYDGEEFHGEEQEEDDEQRRGWMEGSQGWTIVVARSHNVYGPTQNIDRLLLEGYRQAPKSR